MTRLSQGGRGSGSAASRGQRASPKGSLGLLSSWVILAAVGGKGFQGRRDWACGRSERWGGGSGWAWVAAGSLERCM